MEEQASLNARLMEENRRYIADNEKLKARSRAGSSFNHNEYCYNDDPCYPDPDGTSDLADRIMALQLQNSELSLCLEREKRKRKEAESRVDKDRGYIKRLEDSVQTLRGTRVVMDPNSYRQVAEAYIAARRTPARRPHTHSGMPGSDLVCDSPTEKVMGNQQMMPLTPLHHTSSCPSPSTCPSPNPRLAYPKLDSLEYQMYSGDIPMARKTKKDRNQAPQDLGRGLGGLSVGGNPMNPWDYQQLLKNLEDIDGSSRGALS